MTDENEYERYIDYLEEEAAYDGVPRPATRDEDYA